MKTDPKFLALGSRLKGVPEVLTLGVRPNFFDYSPEERASLIRTGIVLYPTLHYAQFFTTMGKRIFPSLETYLYADEKMKQTTLFYLLGVPHPRTRFYYALHHDDILRDFAFPFVGKIPRSSSQGRGVFKIKNPLDLKAYLQRTKVAYVQEYLPHRKDLRIILINYRPVVAYWREVAPGDFRTNIAQGGRIQFHCVPEEALHLAVEVAQKCRFNDVGLDLIHHQGQWLVMEANMKYGRKGLKMKSLSLKEVLRKMLLSGDIS